MNFRKCYMNHIISDNSKNRHEKHKNTCKIALCFISSQDFQKHNTECSLLLALSLGTLKALVCSFLEAWINTQTVLRGYGESDVEHVPYTISSDRCLKWPSAIAGLQTTSSWIPCKWVKAICSCGLSHPWSLDTWWAGGEVDVAFIRLRTNLLIPVVKVKQVLFLLH